LKKKILIIVFSVVGALAVGGGVAYFFFWEDLRVIFKAAPSKGKGPKGGGVDLVTEFSSGGQSNKPEPSPTAPSATTGQPQAAVQAESPKTTESSTTEEGGEGGGVDLGGTEESPGEEEAPAEKETKPPAPSPKAEPVPTLSRKSAATPATPKPPAPPAPPKETKRAAPAPPPKTPRAAAAPSGSAEMQKKVQSLMTRRKYAEAEALLTKHLTANPTDGDAYFMMGFLRIQQNRKAQAIPFFKTAIQTSKDPQIRAMAEQYLKKLR